VDSVLHQLLLLRLEQILPLFHETQSHVSDRLTGFDQFVIEDPVIPGLPHTPRYTSNDKIHALRPIHFPSIHRVLIVS